MKKKLDIETNLDAKTIVLKSDKRIEFRGKLDSLLASFILAQRMFKEMKEDVLYNYMDEFYSFIQKMIYADAMGEKVALINMFGFDEAKLREISHNPSKYFGIKHLFGINAKMPITVLTLNQLRTQIRECEVSYMSLLDKLGYEENNKGFDLALNRLSSAIYILMCLYAVDKKSLDEVTI